MSDNPEALPELPEPAGFIDADGECHIPFYSDSTSGIYTADQMRAYARAALAQQAATPTDMVLHCPACGMQHIDAREPDDFGDGCEWENPPHRSHLCHGCGHIWRPADVPTNGVAAVQTKGKADSPIAASRQAATPAPAEPPLLGRWHHGEGYLCSGSLRIARADFDTNPTEEFRDKVLDWMVETLNAELRRYAAPPATPAPAEPVAHMYPSDLERFQTSETFATAYSVAVCCPDERSVPLYAAPPATPAAQPADEREAFADHFGAYPEQMAAVAWAAWQARAALEGQG